jgi:hypothetical protein
LPVPLAPLVIVIQLVAVVAVHAQLLPAVTVTDPVASAAVGEVLVGSIEYVHGGGGGGGGAADCVTVNVCVAIVIVPVRAAPVLAATVKPREPSPEPLAPLVIVSQDALLVAVHAHPLGAVTATGVPEPPVSAMLWLLGLIE